MIFLGALVAVAVLEIVMRLLPSAQQLIPDTDDSRRLYAYDRLLGWRLAANVEVSQTTRDFAVVYRTNAQGFRAEHDWSKEKPARKVRVAVFGDSFTFGFGVSEEKTFVNLLKEDGKYEVLNFGVPAYDPGQYLLSLTNEGLRYEPDIVVMALYLGNDLDDLLLDHQLMGSKRFKPYFTLDEAGNLKLNNVPVPEGAATEEGQYTRLKRNLFASLFGWMLNLRTVQLMKNPLKEYLYPLLTRLGLVKSVEDYIPTLNVLDTIFRRANASTAYRFRVLIIPSGNIQHNYWERELGKAVEERLNVAGIRYASLVPDVVASSEQLYFPHDRHWNEKGAALAAAKLKTLLDAL